MRNFNLLFVIMISFIILSGCETNEKNPITTSCEDVHWTHNGTDDGQDKWVFLCTDFSPCGKQRQSPINISSFTTDATLPVLDFSYSSTTTEIVNDGHAIKFVCQEGSKLTVGSKQYKLIDFHYHAQSEHQIDGQSFPLEVHFVHKASETDLAVVGVLFVEGEENDLFTKFLSHFPDEKGTYNDTTKFELSDLLPENKSFYHYNGSLTTPPCSEVVSWYVLKNKVTASSAQLNKLGSILKNNYRYVQSLYGRIVYSRDT